MLSGIQEKAERLTMTGGFIRSAEKLAAVRQELTKQGLDGMLLTRADRFQGEEVRKQDEYLAWLTGFTGSAGVRTIYACVTIVVESIVATQFY